MNNISIENEVLSLQCLCARILIQQCTLLPNTIENNIDSYRFLKFIRTLGLTDYDEFHSGLDSCFLDHHKRIQNKFPTMLIKVGVNRLEEMIGSEYMAILLKMYENENYVKRRMESYRTGTVVEKEKLDPQEKVATRDGFYPLAALLQGVEWPSDVDPSRREEYLHPDDFARTFGMEIESFLRLPAFKKTRLKKEKGLF